ncbi:hypothetical protein HMSSN139_52960 [Paenibacillus sp. HMSSN-139]|nr:hypothetical protein HMSSN139_52960 [Paenibacillus sp. HMSSN-139]
MSRASGLYAAGDSYFHRMDGAVKLILLLTWTVVTFLFMDLRVFAIMLAGGVTMLLLARVPFRNGAAILGANGLYRHQQRLHSPDHAPLRDDFDR